MPSFSFEGSSLQISKSSGARFVVSSGCKSKMLASSGTIKVGGGGGGWGLEHFWNTFFVFVSQAR